MSKQNTNSASTLLIAIVVGACMAMVIALALCALGAVLLATERAGEGSAGIIVVITLILSSAIGAVIALRKARRQMLLVSLGTGGVFFLLLLACTAMFFGGQYRALGVTALTVFAGSSCAALLALRGDRPKKRNSKYHNMKLVQNRQTGN